MDNNLKIKLEKYYDDHAWRKITLGQALVNWSQKYKDTIAISDNGKEFSYEQLNEEANKFAYGFKEQGFEKGDKVVLQIPNSWEFVVISFAFFKLGVIPIMALPAHRETELKGIFKTSEAIAYIIKDRYLGFDYREMARNLSKQLPKLEKVFVIGDSEEFISFENIKKENTSEFNDNNIDYKEVGLLLLSGGTTGIPKLIPRRYTDYLYVAEKSAKKCKLTSSSVYLAALPMAHNFPLGCPGVLGTLSVGGKVVICRNTSPDEIIPLIEKEQVTITGLVPAMASMCMEFLEYDDTFDLSTLKVLQIGGSVLDPSIAEKIQKTFGCKLQQIFGIAEGLICCTDLEDSDETIYHNQGKPISEYDEVLIVDENEKEVNEEEFGELIVRGPYTIYGYYNLPEVNKICISEKGYFKTGDKARKMKDGNYQIVGRLRELINRAGEKIMPSEIEELLLKHRYIKEVQVVGVKDIKLGERICVFILEDEKKLSLKDIRSFLADLGTATYKLADQLLYVKNWPLTSVGKIDKKKLKIIGMNENKN
ncbi:MAG: AMP-binding protein [Clostridium botulinum]|nr:AMP-binding protein [Clostridium botulinum]